MLDARLPDLPPAKPESKSKTEPTFTVRAQVARIIGVDLVAVMGVSALTVQTISSAIGSAMSRFATVKHLCAGYTLTAAPVTAPAGQSNPPPKGSF